MAILKYANQSGIVYAYESISEWDPVKKQSRSKRKCLGRVDPDTGEIIPASGRRGRPPKNTGNAPPSKDPDGRKSVSQAEEKLKKLTSDYEKIMEQNKNLLEENRKLKALVSKIKKELADI